MTGSFVVDLTAPGLAAGASRRETHVDSSTFDRLTRVAGREPSRRKVLAAALVAAGSALFGGRPALAQQAGVGEMCGGIAGFQCQPGLTCIDVQGDGCDPAAGGADCAGVCVASDQNPCAAMLCLEGTTCCPNCGGLCVPADVPCSEDLCVPQPCNEAVCGPGEYCCNQSCSRCVPLGQGCTREFCGGRRPGGRDVEGEACGSATCGPDEYCCNESCGICAPIGGFCTEQFCGEEPAGTPCGRTVCPSGQVCCNESCGICTPPDGACIALFCVD